MAMMERPRPAAAQPAAAQPVAAQAPPQPVVAPSVMTGGYASTEAAVSAPPLEAAGVVSEAAPAVRVRSQSPAPVEASTAAATKKKGTTLTAKERRDAHMLSELYSILVATEHLENAFVRGSVSNDAYTQNIRQLIAQFKTLEKGLADRCPDVKVFIKEQGLHCPLAEERLLNQGVGALALYGGADDAARKVHLTFWKASEGFVTLLDLVNLRGQGGVAVDELTPLVRDLQQAIVAIPNLPKLDHIDKITTWFVKVDKMNASDFLNDDEARQLAVDVEQAYSSLKKWLEEKG